MAKKVFKLEDLFIIMEGFWSKTKTVVIFILLLLILSLYFLTDPTKNLLGAVIGVFH